MLILYRMLHLFLFRWIALFSQSSHLISFFFFFFPLHHHRRHKHPNSSSPSDSSVPNIASPRPSILFICPLCLIGKLWWIGPLCCFSSMGTVSIVQCPTYHYWAFRCIPFPSTRLRVLITLPVLAASIIRSTVGSATYQ
jgi:hypothetical protein